MSHPTKAPPTNEELTKEKSALKKKIASMKNNEKNGQDLPEISKLYVRYDKIKSILEGTEDRSQYHNLDNSSSKKEALTREKSALKCRIAQAKCSQEVDSKQTAVLYNRYLEVKKQLEILEKCEKSDNGKGPARNSASGAKTSGHTTGTTGTTKEQQTKGEGGSAPVVGAAPEALKKTSLATPSPRAKRPKPILKIAIIPANKHEEEKPIVEDGALRLEPRSSTKGSNKEQPHAVITKEGFQLVTMEGEDSSPFKNISCDDLDCSNIELIGSGQFGRVFRVHHNTTGETFAMKEVTVPVGFSTGEEAERNNLFRELQLFYLCDSPYVVKFRGCFFHEHKLSLLLEHMDAGNLVDLYKKAGRCPEAVLMKVAFSVLNALTYLKMILRAAHRDIKPDNMLVNRNGDIKLCDFGISNFMVEQSILETRCGTRAYLAPERVDPDKSAYDARADVWSLGITLVELATGAHPYTGRVVNGMEMDREGWGMLSLIMNGQPPVLPRGGEYSDDLCAFVERCLIKDQDERPGPQALMSDNFIVRQSIGKRDDVVGTWVRHVLDADDARGESGGPEVQDVQS